MVIILMLAAQSIIVRLGTQDIWLTMFTKMAIDGPVFSSQILTASLETLKVSGVLTAYESSFANKLSEVNKSVSQRC
jgi:hypothetical protein